MQSVTNVQMCRLLLWGFGAILILYFALWQPCHNIYSQAIYIPEVDFDISSEADAEEMRTYTVVDGLVGPVVPVIFQDSRGALWSGSEIGGVSRFNGQNRTFEPFRLEDGFPRGATQQILEDRWGYIWFLTQLSTEDEGTVSYFNGTNIETVGRATCLALDSRGDIWAANNQGLTHYTETYTSSASEESDRSKEAKGSSIKSTHYPLQETADVKINVLFQSKDGTFWLGGSDSGGILLLSFEPDVGFKDEVADIAKRPPVFTFMDDTCAIQDITQGPYGVEHLWFASLTPIFFRG